MAQAECPRCRAEIAMSATDCAACGKPIAPVPWLRRLRGPGRRAPHAQVIDWARTCFPIQRVAFGVVWIIALAGGVWGMLKTREALDEQPAIAAKMVAAMERDELPPHIREGITNLHEGIAHGFEAVETLARLVALLGLVGLWIEFNSFRQMRRVVRAFPPPGGAT